MYFQQFSRYVVQFSSVLMYPFPAEFPYKYHRSRVLLPYFTLQPMKMDLIEGSETSAIINQTTGNYPKENLVYSVHGESLKSRMIMLNLSAVHNLQ